jgi:hypothetical protein
MPERADQQEAMSAAMKRHHKFAQGVTFAAGAAISSGVLGNLCFSTFVPGQMAPTMLVFLVTTLVGFAAFGFSVWQLKRVAQEALSSRARVASDPADLRWGGRPVLIMGLSPLRDAQEASIRGDIEHGALRADEIALPVHGFGLLQSAAKAEGRPLAAATPWQQNIRAMWFHANPEVPPHRRLKKVLVLPSEESRGQFALFKAYGKTLFGAAVEIDHVRQASGSDAFFCIRDADGKECRDYESYDYVRDGLQRGLQQAKASGNYTDADICIDATPGQKPFSIAAAIITLNTDVVFSYVTTNQPGSSRGGEVKLYDAHIYVTGVTA